MLEDRQAWLAGQADGAGTIAGIVVQLDFETLVVQTLVTEGDTDLDVVGRAGELVQPERCAYGSSNVGGWSIS